MRPLFYAKNAIQHFCTITKHKLTVMDLCFKVGLIRQGLAHDLSKYSPTEFMTGVRYFQGVRSPNAAERQELGYSRSATISPNKRGASYTRKPGHFSKSSSICSATRGNTIRSAICVGCAVTPRSMSAENSPCVSELPAPTP